MLNEICAEIKNYFTYEQDKHIGDFAIVDGQITPPFDLIFIINNGDWKLDIESITDEPDREKRPYGG